jgi:DMSO reductase family type II enzyme chaperone
LRPAPSERSALYGLLALAFRHPTGEAFAAFRDGSFAAELQERMAGLAHLSPLLAAQAEWPQTLACTLAELDLREFEARFVQTFDAGAPTPPCPPYERFHRDGDQTSVLLEVSEFYQYFGLEMGQPDGPRELPDHLCAELEFLHFLTFKEGQAEAQDAFMLLQGYRLAQRDFLERHLASWVPRLAVALEQRSPLPFYAWLGRITAGLVTSEVEWLQAVCPRNAAA